MRKGTNETGFTLVELIIAFAIIVIIFAAVVPQFRAIRNSWAGEEGSATIIQNGRVLAEHITRNLSAAKDINSVSSSGTTIGFIIFRDNNDVTKRYMVSNNYVVFGTYGSEEQLAGPVSRFQITCYSFDFNNPTTDGNTIRFVQIAADFTNADALGTSKTFTASAYLRTNAKCDNWCAYNDCVFDRGLVGYGTDPFGNIVHYGDPNKITAYGIGTISADHQDPNASYISSGLLKDYATGANTVVTATLTQSGGVVWQPMVGCVSGTCWSGGYDAAVCTDAYNTFHGIVDMTGNIYYGSAGWWTDITFTGLNPAKRYTFATTASRAKKATDGAPGYPDRWSIYTISGVDAATNASTPGTTEVNNPYTVRFNTGNNHDEGYVARWKGINPGTDGTFKVRAEAASDANAGYKAYAFNVFMLQCTDNNAVQITYPLGYQGFSEQKTSSDSTSITIPTPGSSGAVAILGSWLTDTTHTKESGTNRALIFIAHEESTAGSPTLTSVTYGGQAMTKVIERSAVLSGIGNYVAAFILNEAGVNAATSNTFTPTWSAATSSVSYASVFLSNVDQATSIGASASNGTTSGTNPITTSALSTNNGDMVILGATNGNNGSYTLGGGFTEGTDQSVGANGHTGVTGHKSATGADETPSANHSNTAIRQVIIGFVVQGSVGTSSIEGDLLIAAVATDGDTSGTITTAASGWTRIDRGAYSSQVTLGAWWKNAGASESSPTFTWTGAQQAYGWMMCFSGHDINNPISAFSTYGQSSATPTSPAVTTTTNCSLILRLGAFDDDNITVDDPCLPGHTAITMDKSAASAAGPTGLVGYWNLDETSGTTATDSSGSGYNGTLVNMSPPGCWVAGKIGNALYFDAVNDYVSLPIGSLISSLTNCSLTTWVYWRGGTADYHRIWDFGTGTTRYMYLIADAGDTTRPRFTITINGSSNDDDTESSVALTPNTWCHIAVTIDDPNNIYKLYVNGTLRGQNASARYTPSSLGTTTNNWLGRSQYVDDPYFNGTLDDVRIYNRVLSATEIAALANLSSDSGAVSGGAGYVKKSAVGSSGTSTFTLGSSNEARMLTIAIAPADANCNSCSGEILP